MIGARRCPITFLGVACRGERLGAAVSGREDQRGESRLRHVDRGVLLVGCAVMVIEPSQRPSPDDDEQESRILSTRRALTRSPLISTDTT